MINHQAGFMRMMVGVEGSTLMGKVDKYLQPCFPIQGIWKSTPFG